MKWNNYVIMICIMYIIMAVSCADNNQNELMTTTSNTETESLAENYHDEVEEMYKAYLEAYLQNDAEAVVEFYDEYMVAARNRVLEEMKEKEQQNLVSAEFYNLIEIPLDEDEYRVHFKGNDEIELETYDVIKSYLVGIDMCVKEVTKSEYNGINYDYYIVGRKNGEWKILPRHQNGSGFLRNYLMEAYIDCKDEEVKRYLNIAFINYTASPICIDGDGSVMNGSEKEIVEFNEWLQKEYEAYGISGILLGK